MKSPDLLKLEWRCGRSVGRTIYAQVHEAGPSKDDILIGMMDNRDLATRVVIAHNAALHQEELTGETYN